MRGAFLRYQRLLAANGDEHARAVIRADEAGPAIAPVIVGDE